MLTSSPESGDKRTELNDQEKFHFFEKEITVPNGRTSPQTQCLSAQFVTTFFVVCVNLVQSFVRAGFEDGENNGDAIYQGSCNFFLLGDVTNRTLK